MAPPTGASDSILVLRLNGASVDRCQGALGPHLQNYSMAANENRVKKNWGDKWNMTRSGKSGCPIDSQMIESSSFMVHPDYLNKYGTLSNGVLNKSVKYAETRLYGTVGVRPAPTQRPSLFLYPAVVGPPPRLPPNQSSYLSSPANLLAMPIFNYVSSEANGRLHSPSVGSRKVPDQTKTGCGCPDVKITSRNGTVRGKSLSKDTISGREKRIRASVQPLDPYNLMRRSRLGNIEIIEPSATGGQSKRRNASASPVERQSRESTSSPLETFKPKLAGKEVKLWKNREEEISRRKSILECDVDVYELNKSKSKDFEDSTDELNLSDPAVDDSGRGNKSRPKSNKTDRSNGSVGKSQVTNHKVENECLRNSEVRLNGQRFKIFEDSNRSPKTAGELFGDSEKTEKGFEASDSPKRPPRRPKEKGSADPGFKYTKLRSKSSPNLSIKSILKKQSKAGEVGDISTLDLPVADLEVVPGLKSSASQICRAVADDPQPSPPDQPNFQGTLKKKKQVQFRVNNSYESLDEPNDDVPVEAETKDSNLPKLQKTEMTTDEDGGGKSIDRSNSCDDLSLPSLKGRESNKEEAVHKKEKIETAKEVFFNAEPGELKRSYSDRRLTSALVLPGRESSPTTKLSSSSSDLFHDTTALRTRTAKPDSRQVFPRSSRFVRKTEVESATNMVSNPWTKCSEKLAGNTISYAEFTKLPDKCTQKKENRTSKTGSKKPKVSLKSYIPVKTNSCFPSPPPRHVPTDKSTRSGVKVFVKVPVNDFRKKDETEKDSTNGVGRKEPLSIEKENSSEIRPECESEMSEGKTIVRLNSNPPDESVEITGASITIRSKNAAPASKDEPQRRTSLIIGNFHGQDSNKVTISVRNESSDDEANQPTNPSTCTIIETGSNSTVIPVVSTDNKTTLIVGSQTSVRAIDSDCDALGWTSSPKPTRYVFAETHFEANKSIESLDPVEAIKRNLIPHICGKEDGVLTLMQRLRQSRDGADGNQISKNEDEEKRCNDNEFASALKNKKCRSESERHSPHPEKNSQKMTSLNGHTSEDTFHPLTDMNFYAGTEVEELEEREKDKLECEYEITNGFRNAESENLYETIKDEPIYDQIRDRSGREAVVVPPPLPQTQPQAADETEKQKMTVTKSMFEGASKYEILNYLVDAKERVQEESYWSGGTTPESADFKVLISSDDKEGIALNKPLGSTKSADVEKSLRCDERPTISENESEPDSASRISSQLSYSSDDNATVAIAPENDLLKLTKARKSSAEIERNDSGVGSETSHTSRNRWLVSSSIREDPHHLCEDCDQVVETQITDGGVMYVPLVCRKCAKKRSERKEIIQEIVETEEKYGRDLKIILEEFYRPMLVAGLLTPDQLSSIFLNTEELLENSELLTERLRDTLEIAADQGDEDLVTVNVGKLFIDAEPMLHAFETYCIRQGAAAMLLAGLEKEKELLRIFLRVSQMENAVLRRMNLNSFLMVPVQRVTKYPLLLARLYKVTPAQQEGRELLKEAQHNIELHLEHMNSEAKDVSGTKVWRRFSTSAAAGRKFAAESEMINIKLRKMAVDALEWNHEEVRFILEGKLMYTQPTDNNWKRGRTIKLSPIFVLLVTLGKPNSRYRTDPGEDELTFPTKTGIREATLLLVKEKCGRYTLIREPLYLDKTIVCCESEMEEYFEVQELSTKESFIFKAEDGEKTKEWYKQVQYHAQILGAWRKRRNALANIMINGMLTRGCTS